jgi:hypothetical protein
MMEATQWFQAFHFSRRECLSPGHDRMTTLQKENNASRLMRTLRMIHYQAASLLNRPSSDHQRSISFVKIVIICAISDGGGHDSKNTRAYDRAVHCHCRWGTKQKLCPCVTLGNLEPSTRTIHPLQERSGMEIGISEKVITMAACIFLYFFLFFSSYSPILSLQPVSFLFTSLKVILHIR